MKILLTGAGGMVGQNILEHPSAAKYGWLSPNRKEMDLKDRSAISSFLKKHKPDLVVHCAGRVGGIQANIKNPVDFLLENLELNMNLIDECHKAGIKKLINMGSSCMYPRDAQNPLREEMILKGELEPTNEGYALAKIAAQRLCEYIMREDPSVQYKTLIPCNLYGRYDKFDPAHSHLVPAVISKIHDAKKKNLPEVEIWGDGKARREFMYSGDVAACALHSISEFATLPNLVNVGLGHDYSVNEYYQAVAEVIGYRGHFVHNTSKPVGMSQKMVSIDLLNKWGWKSQVSLKQGIEKTYKFFLEHVERG